MTYPAKALRAHPGRNPRFNGGGNRYHDRSRWLPHVGKREIGRFDDLPPVIPTKAVGAGLARGDRRRADREARNAVETATAAAKRRHAEAKALLPRKPKAKVSPRLSPVPEDFAKWSKAKRRAWVNDREIARQQTAAQALVRRGVPEAEARRRFGSL
jgi:hypothetical protein